MHKRKSYKSVFLLLTLILIQSCSVFNSGLKTSDSPTDSKIITSDIDNFYYAFDLAINDSANAEKIFKLHYFKNGSKGLKDFYQTKIQSTGKFTNFVLGFKDYYQSIRNDITGLGDLENQIHLNFRVFEKLYPQAKYPDVYFLVGKYQSNGTISKNGILIGTEILARTANSDTANWNKDILRISMQRKHIPVTISHELVHFNQDKMKDGNTLLWKSIREGSAEFISELISGKTDANFEDFEGKELEIWNDFKNNKDKSVWGSWQQENDLRPRNAGYWVGYMICKAYYKEVGNKEKAVKDILSIQDYEDFLKKSEVDNYIQNKFGK